ncbi:MAG: hypothetical protein ABJA57_04330, partial [Ginsengibacter sp.]
TAETIKTSRISFTAKISSTYLLICRPAQVGHNMVQLDFQQISGLMIPIKSDDENLRNDLQ